MKRLLTTIAVFLALAGVASAQAVIVPSPVPALTNNCTLKWQTGTNTWVCSAASSASQPLTDTLGLMADGTDATKILALELSGITTGTTRTWTIPDANLTIPSTVASLGANTFTGLQTANGGLATTTLTASSNVTLSGTGNAVGTITSGVWNAGAVTSSGGISGTTGTFSGAVTLTAASTVGAVAIDQTGTNAYAGFTVKRDGTEKWFMGFSDASDNWILRRSGSTNDLTVDTSGNTTIAGTLTLAATKQFYLDGGGDTYITEGGANNLSIYVGGTRYLQIDHASGAPAVAAGIIVGADSTNNKIDDASTGAGSATLYIGNASINVTSDRRLKANIVDSTRDSSSILAALRVRDFTWNDPSDTAFNNRNARGLWTGLIAQEVVEIAPWVVNAPRRQSDLSIDYDDPSPWHIEYEHLVPTLIAGWQSHDARIAALEAELAALKTSRIH